jgi:hypothetical protein
MLPAGAGCWMRRYYFRVCDGYSAASGDTLELGDNDSVWTEMTKVGADLVGDATRKLGQNDQWRLELIDEADKPLFRIRLVAETLGQAAKVQRSASQPTREA